MRIRYDRPAADYADALDHAVSATLERLPEAAFDLVAVTPARSDGEPAAEATDAAQRHAEEVMGSLLDMGLTPERLALFSAVSDLATASEVHVYIR